MKDTNSFVNLNCLNCGARLKITDNVFEFACQHCGSTQIVQRSGGIVALKILSDKIDHVQNSVDKTAAELKIQRFSRELEEIEERHSKLEGTTYQLKGFINQSVFGGFLIVFAVTGLLTVLGGTIVPLMIGGIIEFVIFALWRKEANRIDSDFNSSSKPMIEKGIELKREIRRLEKIVEY